MSNEYKIVSHLDETIWDVANDTDAAIGVRVADDKVLDIIGALYDIWEVSKTDVEEAQELVIGLAALLIAAPLEQAKEVWDELVVKESMKNFELRAEDILDGKE